MILAGDIGATKTNLGIFSLRQGPDKPLAEARFRSSNYTSLEAMVGDFLAGGSHGSLKAACFGVAGPVKAGSANITNLKWFLEERHLSSALGVQKVRLLNDIAAIASALPLLDASDLETLNAGITDQNGIRAVIAPGTGLGEAFLTWERGRWQSHATEGGHVDFAPVGEEQVGLLHHLLKTVDHVSYELTCSGIGIPHIYSYLKESGRYEVPAWSDEAGRDTGDLTPAIIEGALRTGSPDPLCSDTVRMFLTILAAEAGNLALKVLPTGGMYIGGGIPLRILPLMKSGSFMETFTSKGRLSRIMADIPVHVILNTKAPLIGAAKVGLELLNSEVVAD